MKKSFSIKLGLVVLVVLFVLPFIGCDAETTPNATGNKVNRALATDEANYLYSLHASENTNIQRKSLMAKSVNDIANAFRDVDFTFCRIEDVAEETMEPDGQPVLVAEGLNGDGTYIYRFTYIINGYKYEVFCNKEYSKDKWLIGDGWGTPPSDCFHSDSDGCWFFFY